MSDEKKKKKRKYVKFKVTDKRMAILNILDQTPGGMGPTEIGLSCGIRHSIASSWGTETLASLRERKLVSRREGEGNVVTYTLTAGGRRWLMKYYDDWISKTR